LACSAAIVEEGRDKTTGLRVARINDLTVRLQSRVSIASDRQTCNFSYLQHLVNAMASFRIHQARIFSAASFFFVITYHGAYPAFGRQEGVQESIVRVEGAVQGSGVLVQKKNSTFLVLTAWHVLKSNQKGEEISLVTHDGRKHLSSIAKAQRIGQTDMAVISFDSDQSYLLPRLRRSDSVKHQDIVSVYGYPNASSLVIRREVGSVVANTDVGIDQGYQLLYTSDTSPGMSGGPVFDVDNELVGIHGRGETSQKKYRQLGAIEKTNINQGIPLLFYMQFESGKQIQAKSEEATTWDDYLALYQSIYAEQEQADSRFDFVQTLIRLASKLIELRPDNSFGWILRAEAEHELDPSVHVLDNKFAKTSLSLAAKYQDLETAAWKASGNGDIQRAIELSNEALEYVHGIGPSIYYLMGASKIQIGDLKSAISILKQGLELSKDLISKRQPLWLKQLSDEEKEKANMLLIGSLYNALGYSYYQSERINDSFAAYREAIGIQLGIGEGVRSASVLRDAFRYLSLIEFSRQNKINGCDYYFDSKRYGDSNPLAQKLCQALAPRYGDEKMTSLMEDAAKTICQTSDYYVNFFDEWQYLKDAIKDSRMVFKSEASMDAWAFTVAWNAYKLCPNKSVPGMEPADSWDFSGYWDHHNPTKPN
jgi:V8-like Glu-specific endopeptidase